MNKEQLKKLAEVAGYEDAKAGDELHEIKRGLWFPDSVYVLKKGDLSNLDPVDQLQYRYEAWYPHENIAQAFEVLDGWQENEDYIVQHFKSNGVYICQLASPCRIPLPITMGNTAPGATHAEAICSAVLKAVKF